MKKILIASTSTLYGGEYLEYLHTDLCELYKNTDEVLFIPYARPNGLSHESYTNKALTSFEKIKKKLVGIHEFNNPIQAVKDAKGIFVGGGNTFVLVKQLYKNNILPILKEVVNSGTPYLGTSAGSNICGLTMNTTNDMPIVLPPNFKTLGVVPFNINPHYLDPQPDIKHMGESRETRIKEFHCFNTQPVVGLREGSWIDVNSNQLFLKGEHTARVFEYNKTPYEVDPGFNFKELK